MKHSDETLYFSSKEKDKITFGKKQSFFPNETQRWFYINGKLNNDLLNNLYIYIYGLLQ
jgi:uncharacterized protein YchJ